MVRTHTTAHYCDRAGADPLPKAPTVLGLVAAVALLGLGSAARADTYPAMYVANHTFSITLADGSYQLYATGARLRSAPLTPPRVRAALQAAGVS